MVLEPRLHVGIQLLAGFNEEEPTRLRDITERLGVSLSYTEVLCSKLIKAGFIKSKRGPNGGYCLATPLNKIKLSDFVTVANIERDSGEKTLKNISSAVEQTEEKILDLYKSVTLSDLV